MLKINRSLPLATVKAALTGELPRQAQIICAGGVVAINAALTDEQAQRIVQIVSGLPEQRHNPDPVFWYRYQKRHARRMKF